MQAELRNRLSIGKDDDINFVKYSKYKKSFSTYSTSKNEIAVIVADGDIMRGKASKGLMASIRLLKNYEKRARMMM